VHVPEDDPAATHIVSVGRPIAGVDIRLGRPSGLAEIRVASPSLFSGYYREPGLTNDRLRDGEVWTGDIGFFSDGDLHVVGRSDDVIAVGGRNVYAREIEAAVGALPPVRSGCCTIVDVPTERGARLVMLLELRDSAASGAFDEVATAASQTAITKAGVDIDECLFLEQGALPKTPTGKVQRFRCRELVRTERIEPLAQVSTRRIAAM
jgi:fatty-acyl-CoA synthase